MAKAKGTTETETASETEAVMEAQAEAEAMTAEAPVEQPVQAPTETPAKAEATAAGASEKAETPKAGETVAEKEESFVYIGPSLPGGKLKKNTVFQGTKSAIMAALAPVLEEYPKVKRMLVPVGSLADSQVRIRNGGNVLRRTYDELAAGKAAEKEVTGNE